MKKTLVAIAVLGYFGACVLLVAGLGYAWHRSDPAPEQPIAFPHTVHAGQLQIPCSYCHVFVERSRHAGAPPLEICMGCHRSIATDREAIRTLTRHYEEKTGRRVEAGLRLAGLHLLLPQAAREGGAYVRDVPRERGGA